MGMLTYLYVQPQKRSQVSRLGTESFIPDGTQKPTEGTGTKNPTFGETKMAQVTYRGVKYDTDTRKADAPAKSEMIYRGVRHNNKVAV